ncbi:MAG: methyltransferase domain-containing protein [Planctomycetota bacterium]|jgi:2-polyprenyl-3-methyl-5-hydroxy-6-metoxy-1,4-benzoquinol methylase|nr:methyltransferase domain-containing protein [Planctomycetota bacterium]
MAMEKDQIYYSSCPGCSCAYKPWRSKQVGEQQYRMDVCQSCGYCFVNPRPSLAFLMDYYSTFGHGDAEIAQDKPTLESVQKREKSFPNSTVDAKCLVRTIQSLANSSGGSARISNRFLDVGCGYGFFSHEAQRAGFEVQALELAAIERQIAHQMTGLDPTASSFEEYVCEPSSLGVVLMSQILEHVLDVNLWIEKAHRLLVPGGILAIALPNYGSITRKLLQERDPFVCPPTHLNFFSPRSLSCLLRKHGFEVAKIEWVSRLPKSSFEKRCPSFARPLLPLVHFGTSLALQAIDLSRLGMVIRVYGRKKS